VIGLGGGEFTVMAGIGPHYSTNGKIEHQMGVWSLYEVCALPQNTERTATGQSAEGCNPLSRIGLVVPLSPT